MTFKTPRWKHRSQGPKSSGKMEVSKRKLKKVKSYKEEKVAKPMKIKLEELIGGKEDGKKESRRGRIIRNN